MSKTLAEDRTVIFPDECLQAVKQRKITHLLSARAQPRIAPGMRLHLRVGRGQAGSQLVRTVHVALSLEITIDPVATYLHGRKLHSEELWELSRACGVNTVEEFIQRYIPDGEAYCGWLVTWYE